MNRCEANHFRRPMVLTETDGAMRCVRLRAAAEDCVELAFDARGPLREARALVQQSHGTCRCRGTDRIRQQQEHDSGFEEVDHLVVEHREISMSPLGDF